MTPLALTLPSWRCGQLTGAAEALPEALLLLQRSPARRQPSVQGCCWLWAQSRQRLLSAAWPAAVHRCVRWACSDGLIPTVILHHQLVLADSLPVLAVAVPHYRSDRGSHAQLVPRRHLPG